MPLAIRRYAIGAALFAALLGACAPSVTRFLAAGSGIAPLLAEFCSAKGSRPSSDTSDPIGVHRHDCPFCYSHAVVHALPPAIIARVFLQSDAVHVAIGSDVCPVRYRTWHTTQPRAPPAFS